MKKLFSYSWIEDDKIFDIPLKENAELEYIFL
jgi:hypothetical protein